MDRIIKSEEDWSEEHEHLPLKQRLKILRASNQQITDLVIPLVDAVVKKEDQDCVSEDVDSAPFLVEGRVESFPLEECHNGRTRECCIPKIEQGTGCSSNHIITSEQYKVGCDNLISSTVNCLNYCCSAEDKAINAKSEIPAYILDELDHVDLKERRRMLLSRKLLDSRNPVCKDTIIGLATTVVGCLHDAVTGKEDCYSVIEKYPTKGDSSKMSWERTAVVCEDLNFESSNSIVAGSASTKPLSPTSVHQSRGTTTSSECIMAAHKNDICSSKVTSIEHELCGRKNDLYGKHNTVLNSPLTTSVNVKVEPIENNELDNNILENSLMTNLVTVKREPTIPDAFSEDVIDHMLLSARMKLLTPREIAKADIHSEGSRKIVLSSVDCQPISSKSDPPAKIKRSRKRKKTATDSVETALEEDVPGLLQVLVDKGVLIDEMKLYGQTEIDEAIDESLTEFSELEAVISKLFSQRSLLKLAPLKGTKGEKTSYCLACLISLVEQARYLQFRKWPVEWGWCRDLQSFIFVFERHNRIVLERPEYGYATYFFELVDSLTIDWQIKRLVTTMKLTSCSRIALIENKALTVGEDLTEGEAGVLSDYGWIPDTGLGTMLNYRDRVVHDRKNETDSSEWRSKIGNLLMDGFNGGTIISTSVPKKFVDNSVVQNLPIKLEI